MPFNLHVTEAVDSSLPEPVAGPPDHLRFLTATQMVQAAIGLDLPVAALFNPPASVRLLA